MACFVLGTVLDSAVPTVRCLYIEVARGLEKQRCMLRAHVARPGGNGSVA
jgi:hypothetical protein